MTDFLGKVGDRASVLTSRCVSYGQGITFWPVVQLLRQAVGLQGGESDEVTSHALTALMDGSLDAREVVDLLMPLLGKAGEPGGSEQTFWAVRRAFEQLASQRPVVLTFDDLHWAQPTLLDLIERVRDEVRDLPLLLVCQARPELLDEHPGWGGGSLNSTTFGLEPFSRQQTTDSLAALLGDNVGSEVGDVVAAWAGGNPLFVEEVASHLVDNGLLQLSDTGWELTGDLADARVPPTVAALLAARLDRLPESLLRVVERISLVGLELSLEDAVLLTDGLIPATEVPGALAALAHRDLLQRRRSDAGETWAFRHILLRDAAYDSLPKVQRADLHERFAGRIDDLAGEVGPEHLAFAAHHLEQALRFRRELAPHDPVVPALAERAADVLRRAAEDARDREDLAAAAVLLRRAVDLDPPTSRQRRGLLLALVQVHADEEHVADLVATAEELAAATDETAGEVDRIAVEMLRGLGDLSRSQPVAPLELSALARRCADMARAAGRDRLLLLALTTQANCEMMRARWAEVAVIFDEMGTVGSTQERRWARLFRGASVLYGTAPISDMRAQVDEILAHGGHSPTEEDQVRLLTLTLHSATGRSAMASALAAEEEHPAPALPAVFRLMFLGVASCLAGELDHAIRNFRGVLQVMLDAGDLSHASTILPWIALLLTEVEEPPLEEIERLVEHGAEVTSPYDVLSVALVAGGRGMVAALHGRHDEARAGLEQAIAICEDSDQLWQQADFRRWAATAAALRGDTAEQRRLLTEALELYRTKGMAVWVARCTEELAWL